MAWKLDKVIFSAYLKLKTSIKEFPTMANIIDVRIEARDEFN